MNTQKKRAASLAALIGIGAAVAVSITPQSASAQTPGRVRLAANRPVRKENHPTMLAALRALVLAQKNLNMSSHDFGGHRVKALALTQQAIAEMQKALQYDRGRRRGASQAGGCRSSTRPSGWPMMRRWQWPRKRPFSITPMTRLISASSVSGDGSGAPKAISKTWPPSSLTNRRAVRGEPGRGGDPEPVFKPRLRGLPGEGDDHDRQRVRAE